MDRRRSYDVAGLTAWEIVDAFPDECKTILPREIKWLKLTLQIYLDHINDIQEEYPNDVERNFLIALVEMYMPQDRYNLYKKLLKIKKTYQMRKKYQSGTKLNIEYVKMIPLETLYDFQEIRSLRNRITALCPFHNEKTPSFFIYTDKNQYHCFGCGVHGDSINFIQKLYNLNFVEAVKYLMGGKA